jgi:hypothetical protein
MIFIPEILWGNLLDEFRRLWRRLEQVAYLDGVETGDVAVVTTLTFPDAILKRTSFSVTAQAMSEAGQHLGSLTRISQVHTHPGVWVGHSNTDNHWAYSLHDGAMSIVLPNYGKSVRLLSDVGVHVCRNGIWRELTTSEKEGTLRIIPSLMDFR